MDHVSPETNIQTARQSHELSSALRRNVVGSMIGLTILAGYGEVTKAQADGPTQARSNPIEQVAGPLASQNRLDGIARISGAIPNKSAIAKLCLEEATGPGRTSILAKQRGHIRHARHISFLAIGQDVFSDPNIYGKGCDQFGSRTIKAWEVMENSHGKKVQNSNTVTLARNNNHEFQKWFTLKLKHPYTCKKDVGKRYSQRNRYWGFRVKTTATYNHVTKSNTDTIPGDSYIGYGYC